MFLEMNGHCGTRPAPGLLPLLSGEPASTCPTGLGLLDADVLVWGQVADAWSDEQPRHLTPRARAVVRLLRKWRDAPEFKSYVRAKMKEEMDANKDGGK